MSSSYRVHLLAVSSATPVDPDSLSLALTAAGQQVLGLQRVDAHGLREAARAVLADPLTQVLLVVGGVGPSGATPEAIHPLLDTTLPGFGELLRTLAWSEVGAEAMLYRATAGLAGGKAVFAIPCGATQLALDRLILPSLAALLGQGQQTAAVDQDGANVVVDILPPPAPSHKLGQLGGRKVQLSAMGTPDEAPPPADDGGEVSWGWQQAIRDLGGEVLTQVRQELPERLEKVAPIVNVLETAGETAVLKLPSGRRLSLWGWPDLQRPGAKVIAVGEGEPLAEVIALHRHPVMTGLCVEGPDGLLPDQSSDIAATAEEITGRAPRDTSGTLFAVTGDAIFVQRGNRVYRWDGRHETHDGNPKQVLATLVLNWSNR
ncbi:MAG: hypothetical protein JXX28_13565 [Deltaproteobacteria bacterium]|nr:hypothetical protein [Deltaproteobacteria bacterium]